MSLKIVTLISLANKKKIFTEDYIKLQKFQGQVVVDF